MAVTVVVAEEEASTEAVVVAAFTAVAGAGSMAVVAGLATVAAEVRDLSAEEVLTEAEAFAADHRRTTSEPAEVPMADSADRAA
jgi:nucleoid-associated protein YgaU